MTTNEATPYDELIGDGNPNEIQKRYELHRTQRNEEQKRKLLSGEVKRLSIDHILYQLLHPEKYPGFVDPRHCLVVWGRPTGRVQGLISQIQARLREAAPKDEDIWLMPLERQHLTIMEVTHSQTEATIASLVTKIKPRIEEITDYTYSHRTRLIKPMVGFDDSALALSFVPAASKGTSPSDHDDRYTYHHLRRDVWKKCRDSGLEVASRYVLPSAHLTIARFVTNGDHSSSTDFDDEPSGDGKLDLEKMKAWLDKIDQINDWLKQEYWPRPSGEIPAAGQWIVGEECGMDLMAGTIWYGRDSISALRSGRAF